MADIFFVRLPFLPLIRASLISLFGKNDPTLADVNTGSLCV